WAAAHEEDLNELEREFLAASAASEQQELARARRHTRRLRALAFALAVLVVAASLAAGYASWQSSRARHEQSVATSRLFAARAAAQLDVDPQESLRLAVSAVKANSSTDEAVEALREALAAANERAIMRGHHKLVTSVAFSPDGRRLLTASDDGTGR